MSIDYSYFFLFFIFIKLIQTRMQTDCCFNQNHQENDSGIGEDKG